MRTETDLVFRLAGERDPFVSDPYLAALLDLPPHQRKAVILQVILLCGAVDGLDPLGALELLAQIAPYVGGDPPLTAGDR